MKVVSERFCDEHKYLTVKLFNLEERISAFANCFIEWSYTGLHLGLDRCSFLRVFYKSAWCLEEFCENQRSILALESFVSERGLHRRYFPANCAKFIRLDLLQNPPFQACLNIAFLKWEKKDLFISLIFFNSFIFSIHFLLSLRLFT